MSPYSAPNLLEQMPPRHGRYRRPRRLHLKDIQPRIVASQGAPRPMGDAIPTLSPAEATVLLAPNLSRGRAAVKVTLLLLLTTGVLRIEESEQAGIFRTRKIAHLRIAREPKGAPAEIEALLGVVRDAQADGGKIVDVVKRAEKTFGPACVFFTARLIVPGLIARGLLTEKKILFFKTFSLTPAGAAVQSRIKSDVFKADGVARLVKSDPAQAAALAKTLGTNVLLSDKLTKQFKPLADAMRAQNSADGGTDGFAYVDTGSAHDGSHHDGWQNGFDFGHFGAGSFDLGSFDSGAIDALHSGMDSFDSGFSDGGGHDGGGGHH